MKSSSAVQLGFEDYLRQPLEPPQPIRLTDYDQLGDAELLQLVLGHDAAHLLTQFDSFWSIFTAPPERLKRAGLSRKQIDAVRLHRAVSYRMAFREVCDQPVLSTWQKLMDYLLVRLSHERNEQFWILFLDRKNCLTFELKVAEGTVDHVPVYPREVVRLALQHDASALLIVHNHPSGGPAPSKADIEITRQLSNALSVINVSLHDHVIVGTGGKYTSFKTNGLF